MLEHGCEVMHNDFLTGALKEQNRDVNQYGWASVQADGGIDSASAKVVKWFEDQAPKLAAAPQVPKSLSLLSTLKIGLLAQDKVLYLRYTVFFGAE